MKKKIEIDKRGERKRTRADTRSGGKANKSFTKAAEEEAAFRSEGMVVCVGHIVRDAL